MKAKKNENEKNEEIEANQDAEVPPGMGYTTNASGKRYTVKCRQINMKECRVGGYLSKIWSTPEDSECAMSDKQDMVLPIACFEDGKKVYAECKKSTDNTNMEDYCRLYENADEIRVLFGTTKELLCQNRGNGTCIVNNPPWEAGDPPYFHTYFIGGLGGTVSTDVCKGCSWGEHNTKIGQHSGPEEPNVFDVEYFNKLDNAIYWGDYKITME